MKGRVAAIAITVLLSAGIVVAFALGGGPSADRNAVMTYYRTISPLASEGGRIVQEDIKPSVGDLEESKIAPEVFRKRAKAWIRQFAGLRARFANVPRTARLSKTAELYDESFYDYLIAFEAFANASRKPTPKMRESAITSATKLADKADKQYDAAREELKRVMREVGATIPADFG